MNAPSESKRIREIRVVQIAGNIVANWLRLSPKKIVSFVQVKPQNLHQPCHTRLDNFIMPGHKTQVESTSHHSKTRVFLFIIVVGGFAIATVWINYQVKVNVQGGRTGGTVREMGTVKLGQTAPDFSVLDLSNRMVSLSGYRGQKVVLLDFWATWCGPCRMEMINLQKLFEKFRNKDFEILSLNQRETAEVARQFINRKKYDFHVLLDSDSAAADKFGVRGIPTLVLVDKNGVIQWLQVGYSPSEDQLQDKISSLLKK